MIINSKEKLLFNFPVFQYAHDLSYLAGDAHHHAFELNPRMLKHCIQFVVRLFLTMMKQESSISSDIVVLARFWNNRDNCDDDLTVLTIVNTNVSPPVLPGS